MDNKIWSKDLQEKVTDLCFRIYVLSFNTTLNVIVLINESAFYVKLDATYEINRVDSILDS